MSEGLSAQQFVKKWGSVELTERAAAHSHFLDLCRLLGHDDPVLADPKGEWFAFEKGVAKTGGGEGFADVWKKGFFAWEYKKKKRDLNAALDQLVRYAAALENPPLQVACDTDRFLIRTAWTNAIPKTYELALADLLDPAKLDLLWAVFHDPEKLRPKETRDALTKEAADKFSAIALRLQGRGGREDVAHFVNQLVFCFFAHSVKLLPNGFFPKLLKRASDNPERAKTYFDQLFAAMETGGEFDLTDIAHFNGGLFDGRGALPLDSGDIGLLAAAGSLDWSQIDPTIFGTLFERFLDPDKRAQIGAHYTDPEKIMMIVEPVILRPLRAEWASAKAEIERFAEAAQAKRGRAHDNALRMAEEVRARFIERLRRVSILDPACGSGNFLYLALQGVKDIELRANLECEAMGLSPRAPLVGPEIVHGIEINPLAAELARTTIWIGDIQWRLRNGIHARPEPILRKLDSIECRDALITAVPSPLVGESREGGAPASNLSSQGRGEGARSIEAEWLRSSPPGLSRGSTSLQAKQDVDARGKRGHDEKARYVEAEWPRSSPPGLSRGSTSLQAKQDVDARGKRGHDEEACYAEAEWPAAEFIVGNPPFLGGKLMRAGLGDDYVDTLFAIYDGRVPREADLVTYWFEKARAQIKAGKAASAGLVATNSIRGGANREVLDRILSDSRVFEAWSDEPWIIDGAAVRVSLICFGQENAAQRLNGHAVSIINSDLTSAAVDLTKARRLKENARRAFMGVTKSGPFDVEGELARKWLLEPLNPNGKPNSEVLRCSINGQEVTGRKKDRWLLNFEQCHTAKDVAFFEGPFEYAKRMVFPFREKSRTLKNKKYWWRYERPRPEMYQALIGLNKFIATSMVAKHRTFVFEDSRVVPENLIIVIARDDDAAFGVLHSRFHEAWSLRLGTWLGVGNDPRYTPTTTFETFPFPDGLTPNIPAKDYANDPRAIAIAEAAKRLDHLRNAWLNPPDLVRIEPEVVAGYPDRILPKDAQAAAALRTRTLTNLYNHKPQWLIDAHRDLDAAVAAAYGWPADISEEDALAALLALNLARP